MNAQLFDVVVGVYGQMLQGGLTALIPAGLAILLGLAIIEMRVGVAWALVDGFVNVPRLAGVTIGVLLQVAITGYLIVTINSWTSAALITFMDWAARASGLLNARQIIWSRPSTMIDAGFILLAPLKSMINGAGALDQAVYLGLYVVGVLFFVGIATTIMLTQVWFILATLAGAVLLAWIPLQWTMFLSSGVIRWLGSTAVRVFVLGLTVAGTIVFLGTLPAMNNSAGAVVSLDNAIMAFGVSFVCFAVCWFTPNMAANHVAGGGGMGVGHVLAGPLAVIGVASAGSRIVSQVSSMVRR